MKSASALRAELHRAHAADAAAFWLESGARVDHVAVIATPADLLGRLLLGSPRARELRGAPGILIVEREPLLRALGDVLAEAIVAGLSAPVLPDHVHVLTLAHGGACMQSVGVHVVPNPLGAA